MVTYFESIPLFYRS